MSKEPINIGDLDPQQRLDVARGNSQQATSVGGEREVCEFHGDDSTACYQYSGGPCCSPVKARAALSPAGGGVILPERKTCDDGYPSDDWLEANAWNRALDEVARLNAKPSDEA